jgi:hypothetical protein
MVALPERHPLHARPMVRLFELKKDRIVLLSCDADPGTALIEGVLQQAGVSSWHPVSAAVGSIFESFPRVREKHEYRRRRCQSGARSGS